MRRASVVLALACHVAVCVAQPSGPRCGALSPDGVGAAEALRAALDQLDPRPRDEHRTRSVDPTVQVVYLVPAGRVEHPLYAHSLDAAIRHLQEWYARELPERKTFSLGDPAVLTLASDKPEPWFREHRAELGFVTFFQNAIDEAMRLMGRSPWIDPDHVWLIYVDADAGCGQCGGCGAGLATGGGFAVMDLNDLHGFLGGPWTQGCEGTVITFGFRPCRFVGGMGHELGHAFGLGHTCDRGAPGCASSIMDVGFYSYPAAPFDAYEQETLAAHPFFAPAASGGPLPDCDGFVPDDQVFLLEPHDGYVGAAPTWLVWGHIDEGPDHTVEVATDAAFSEVVFASTTHEEWAAPTGLSAGTAYHWRVRTAPAGAWSEVRRFTTDGVVTVEAVPDARAVLGTPWPNPSRGQVTVPLTLASPAHVRLALVDALGREVVAIVDRPLPAGSQTLTLDASGLPNGVYAVRLLTSSGAASGTVSVFR